VSGSIVNNLRKIESNEVVTDDLHRSGLQFTKRRFRDAQETSKLLEEAMLANFTKNISPISVQTMQLLAGDESLQLRFVDRVPASDSDTPQHVAHEVTYGADKVVRSTFQGRTSGVLQHMTIGITDVRRTHTPTEYRYWTLQQFDSPPLDAPEKSYYLYAKCSTSAATGTFVLSETAIGMEAVAGYYHFLLALVNSEYSGERSVVTLYGYSEILPGRITTDRIVSTNGKTYFDLVSNEIGGAIKFVSTNGAYKDVSETDATANAANADATEAKSYINNTLPEVLGRLQTQIDNAIESYFYHYNPTLSNAPASGWTTNELKDAHLDDTFRNGKLIGYNSSTSRKDDTLLTLYVSIRVVSSISESLHPYG
jgi:hypothetical protein